MDFDQEQNEILDELNKLDMSDKYRGRAWFKYKGDFTNRLLIAFLKKHVRNCEVVGPAAFIDGFPTEFDILVVSKNASPYPSTNCFKNGDVKLIVEVKKHGFYFKKISAEENIHNYLKPYEDTGKVWFYFTIQENKTLTDATKKVMRERAFFLSTSPNKIQIPGEWKRFIEAVQRVIAA
jgi:hypothetical protein